MVLSKDYLKESINSSLNYLCEILINIENDIKNDIKLLEDWEVDKKTATQQQIENKKQWEKDISYNLQQNKDKLKIFAKDNPKNITKWLKSYGNPFDKIGLDNDGISSIEWGVYGLPETFLINKDNKILYKHIGPIMKNDLEKINAFLK